MQLGVTHSNENMIVAEVSEQGMDDHWIFLACYGPPYQSKKEELWESLTRRMQSCWMPQMCMGDLNVIQNQEEKQGS